MFIIKFKDGTQSIGDDFMSSCRGYSIISWLNEDDDPEFCAISEIDKIVRLFE